jgi:hypothetical protein
MYDQRNVHFKHVITNDQTKRSNIWVLETCKTSKAYKCCYSAVEQVKPISHSKTLKDLQRISFTGAGISRKMQISLIIKKTKPQVLTVGYLNARPPPPFHKTSMLRKLCELL